MLDIEHSEHLFELETSETHKPFKISDLKAKWSELGVAVEDVRQGEKASMFGLEEYLEARYDKETSAEITEQMLGDFIEWKNRYLAKEIKSPLHGRTFLRLGEEIPPEMLATLSELEMREQALKLSIGTTSPPFLPYIIESDFTKEEILLNNTDRRRALAFQLPLTRVEGKLREDTKYKAELIREFQLYPFIEHTIPNRNESEKDDSQKDIVEGASPDDVMRELREAVRTEVFKLCEALTADLRSTSATHISGTTVDELPNSVFYVQLLLDALKERLNMIDLPGGIQESHLDLVAGMAPFETQQVSLVNFYQNEDLSNRVVVTHAGPINVLNNAISQTSLLESKAQGANLASMVFIDRMTENSHGDYFYVENMAKDTAYYMKPLGEGVGFSEEELEAIRFEDKPTELAKPLDLEQCRRLQCTNFETFQNARQREIIILKMLKRDSIGEVDAIELGSKRENGERNTNISEPCITMIDITGFSKISEVLEKEFDLSSGEAFVPYFRQVVALSEKMGALSGNWAGDSAHFIFPRENDENFEYDYPEELAALKNLNAQEKSLVFFLALNQLHEQFNTALLDSENIELTQALNSVKRDADGFPGIINEFITETKQAHEQGELTEEQYRERALILAKFSLQSKRYGLKAIAVADSRSQLRNIKVPANIGTSQSYYQQHRSKNTQSFVSYRNLERLITPEFDAQKQDLEKATNGNGYSISKNSFDLISDSNIRSLFEKVDEGYILTKTELPEYLQKLVDTLVQNNI